jgi:homoserine O-succinyltransferase
MTLSSPRTRYADFPAALIRDYTDLEILAETEEGDAYLFASKDKRIAFVTGHPEYDANTLASEYFRDVEAGLSPDIPYNYFPQNDPQNKPRATWRSHGNLLFANWLNYYVYQITPYDLRNMNPTWINPPDNAILKRFSILPLAPSGAFFISEIQLT